MDDGGVVNWVKYEDGAPVRPPLPVIGEKGDEGNDEGEVVSGVEGSERYTEGRGSVGGRGIGSPVTGTGTGVVRFGNGIAVGIGEDLLGSFR